MKLIPGKKDDNRKKKLFLKWLYFSKWLDHMISKSTYLYKTTTCFIPSLLLNTINKHSIKVIRNKNIKMNVLIVLTLLIGKIIF